MSFGFGIGDFVALLQLAKDIRRRFVDAPEQFKAISADVKSLTTVLEDVDDIISERDLSSKQKARIEDIAQSCSIVLQELKVALDKYQELDTSASAAGGKMRRVWKRFKWDQKDIDRYQSRISLNISSFDTVLGLINVKVSLETKVGVDRLHERKDNRERDDERQAILEWLTPINYAPQQHDYLSRREEDTGQWFLDSIEFKKWLDQSNQTFHCPGIPGAGKTILMAVVVDHLCTTFQSLDNVGIAYLYCNFRRQHEQKPADLLVNLLKQFLSQLPFIPQSTKSLYERRNKEQSRPSFKEISQELQSVIIEFSKTFIIIDALDEYSDGDRKKFLQEFFQIQVKTRANLLATSRPILGIKNELQSSILLEIRASDEDVRKYLEGQKWQLPSFVSRSPSLQEEIKTEIIKTVQGMFLLASLHLSSLVGKKSPKTMRVALGKLATGSQAYDCAYNEAMERIEGLAEDSRELAKQVLSWITCAKRPLTTLELQHALAVEIGESVFDEENLPDMEDIVSACAGLITIDEESDIVRLVHYTTQEYFERTQISWFPNAEKDIGTICISYLLLETFETGYCASHDEFEARLEIYPLYDYAACNWGYHARLCGELEEIIETFLRSKAKVLAAGQAMMASRIYYGVYRDRIRQTRITGLHLAAYFGLVEPSANLLATADPDAKDEEGQTPLSWAAQHGQDTVVKFLLATNGVDPDSKDENDQTPLSLAARHGQEAVVELLLAEEDVNPNYRDRTRFTPLLWAAWSGHEAIVKMLLATEGVKPNYEDRDGRTPLSWAIENGHEAVVKILLATENVDPNFKEKYGQTPLSRAIGSGHENIIKILLTTEGVDLNNEMNYDHTPLSWAAANGHEVFVEMLLATEGVDLDSKDWSGRTPLSWAVRNGHDVIVEMLLATENVNPDFKDMSGRTPLSWAVEKGHEIIVEMLLATKGVEPDSKDGRGQTPLSWAARREEEAIFKLLLATNAVDPDYKDEDDQTPLSWAVQYGQKDIVKMLLSVEGVEPDSKDVNGRTPLSWAALHGQQDIVEMLLSVEGVDPDSKDVNGRTPLSWAARYGQEDIVEMLLATEGIDLNSKDNWDRTPLSRAARYGKDAIVKLLLATKKVDADSKDKIGRTPIAWAAWSGHEAIVKMLLATESVDPDSKDQYGRTPLSRAVWNGHEVIVEMLLTTEGVDPDSKDNLGRTPLSRAARRGDEAVFKLLLATNVVDLDSKDRNGRTPLSWAIMKRHEAIVKLLLTDPDSEDEWSRTSLLFAVRNAKNIVIKLRHTKESVEQDPK